MPEDPKPASASTVLNRYYSVKPPAPPTPAQRILNQDAETPTLEGQELESTKKPILDKSAATLFNRAYSVKSPPLTRTPVRQSEVPQTRPLFNTPEEKQRALEDSMTAAMPFSEVHIRKMESTKRNKQGTMVVFTDPNKRDKLIGYGHKLTPDELRSGKIQIGNELVDYRQGLSDDHGNRLLTQDTQAHSVHVKKILANHGVDWNQLPPQAQTVAADLAYQVGPAGFARFKPLMRALRDEDWRTAKKHVDRYYRDEDTGKMVYDARRTKFARELLDQLIVQQAKQ